MKHTMWMVVLAAMFVAAALPAAASAGGEEQEELSAERREQIEQLEFEAQKAELEAEIAHRRGKDKGGGGGVVLLCLVINILLTIWVCKDMREQGIGRALWVPIVLLAGVFGAIIYALVRIADTRGKPAAKARA
ncbi:MAG: hypothetical protein WBF17_00235 [Phycisphaerae bacterium]